MSNVVWFKDIKKTDIAIAGGKGANLGELSSIVTTVPLGFVVNTDCYVEFQKDIKARIDNLMSVVDSDDSEKIERTSKQIFNLVMSSKFSKEAETEIREAYDMLDVEKDALVADLVDKQNEVMVSVRSSATAEDLPNNSFAGQHDTYLNIKGAGNVLDSIRKCFASLYTPRAIVYRETNNIGHDVKMAVVVQKMVPAESAGVMFSANPVTSSRQEIMIEGAWGLGELVVSGSVTPDLYIVQKDPLEIKDIQVNEKRNRMEYDATEGKTVTIENSDKHANSQVITDVDILDLARFGKVLENHFGSPQDIEWAYNKGFFILQSRPITTLKDEEPQMEEKTQNPNPEPSSKVATEQTEETSEEKQQETEQTRSADDQPEESSEEQTQEATEDEPRSDETTEEESQSDETVPQESASEEDTPAEASQETVQEVAEEVFPEQVEETKEEPDTSKESHENEEEIASEEQQKADTQESETFDETEVSETTSEDFIQPKQKIEMHDLLLSKAQFETSRVVLTCHMAILSLLKKRYSENFDEDPELPFKKLVSKLKTVGTVPYEEEIFDIHYNRNKFISRIENFDFDTVKNTLDTTKKFVEEY